jgi:glycosyltransferase involved in cell wall biosynthesis
MKLGIHMNQFDGRGSGTVPYDYGIYLQEYLNHEIVFITSRQAKNDGLIKIYKKWKDVILYDMQPIHSQNRQEQSETNLILEDIVSHEKIDFFHFIKSGENDNIDPRNCKTGVHCVFKMNEPHGSVYAGVSKFICEKYKQSNWVPHIITYIPPTENLREKYNIPKDAFVIGRHGGSNQFNLLFAQQAVINILNHRKDIYFLFLSTQPFITHERIIYINWVDTKQDVFNFIDACDVMLHAREDGETFGLSVAEFSVSNKPVITWSGLLNGKTYSNYDTAHIDILEDTCIIYNNYEDLLDILLNVNKNFINNHNWDKYSIKFSPKVIIEQYKKVFLQNFYA